MSKSDNAVPSPSISIIYFLVITLIYGFLYIYSIYSTESTTIEIISDKSNNILYDFIYMILLLIGLYFININISKTLCNTNNVKWNEIFLYTIAPLVLIFFVIYFILAIFPGWVRPFSNTIGYFIVNLLGAQTNIEKLLINSGNENDKSVIDAIKNIQKDYSRFINEISHVPEAYRKFIEELDNEKIVETKIDSQKIIETKEVLELYQHINVKHLIGKMMWYILSGSLIASITYNFIINITCEKTLEETQEIYDDLYKNSVLDIYGTKWKKVDDTENRINANRDYDIFIEKYKDKTGKFKTVGTYVTFTKHELRLGGIVTSIPNARSIYIQVNDKNYIPVQ